MAKNELISAVNSLNYDIILDEEALKKASQDMKQLFQDVKTLLNEMLDVFSDLRNEGMNTPTGRRIYELFFHSVYEPFADLVYVAEHVSGNIDLAVLHFQSVFDEYRALINELQ